jgi:hypothetical protein
VPIRIIFRGLVLFHIVKEDEENVRIEAQLVDCAKMPGAHAASGAHNTQLGATGHSDVHRHDATIQILTATNLDSAPSSSEEMRTRTGTMSSIGQTVPDVLHPRALLGDISIGDPHSGELVNVEESYRKHCPNLSHILTNAPGFRVDGPPKPADRKRNEFIKSVVTIYGGTIRVREVVTWDAGEYPLVYSPNTGGKATTAAEVRFLGSTVRGHMASECVVDIESNVINGAESLTGGVDVREILITNFPPPRSLPVPWSLHFFCLFQAAGYIAVPGNLRGSELRWFKRFARGYHSENPPEDYGRAFAEDEALLGDDGMTGFPFPYLDPADSLSRLKGIRPPLTDPWNRPLCPQGDNSPHH